MRSGIWYSTKSKGLYRVRSTGFRVQAHHVATRFGSSGEPSARDCPAVAPAYVSQDDADNGRMAKLTTRTDRATTIREQPASSTPCIMVSIVTGALQSTRP